MNSVGTRFIVGFVGSLVGLLAFSFVVLSIPMTSMLVMAFVFASVLVGIVSVCSKSRFFHAGHGIIVFGFVIIIIAGALVAGGVNLTMQGNVIEKSYQLPSMIYNYLLLSLGAGFVMVILGMYISWRKWVKT